MNLVLWCYGEAKGSRDGRSTGWIDRVLSERGIEGARHGADLVRSAGHTASVPQTSVLERAIRALPHVLEDNATDRSES